jgi:hypothetical protein
MDIRETIVGMDFEEAQKLLQENGMILRATTVDGEARMVTMDYRTNRLNVATQDGKVVSVGRVG